MDNNRVAEKSLRDRSDIESDRLDRQRSLAELEKSMVEEEYKDPAEVENRAYMKEQQRLARRYQFRRK